MANTEGVVQVRNSPGSMVVSSTTRKVIPPKNVALDEDEFTDVSAIYRVLKAHIVVDIVL